MPRSIRAKIRHDSFTFELSYKTKRKIILHKFGAETSYSASDCGLLKYTKNRFNFGLNI